MTGFGKLRFWVSLAGSTITASTTGSAFDVRDMTLPVLGVFARGAQQASASAEIQSSDDNTSWSTVAGASLALAACATGNPEVHRILIRSSSARYFRWKVGDPSSGSMTPFAYFVAVPRHDSNMGNASAIVVI